MATKILTIRVPVQIYSELCTTAAERGVPISSHVRNIIETKHHHNQLDMLRKELLEKLDCLSPPLKTASISPHILLEIMLLNRAIATHLNPQIVALVRTKLLNQSKE